MSKTLKVLSVALGAALLIGALGLGAALAADPPTSATSPTEYHKVLLGKVAKILGIEEQKVTNAFTQAAKEVRNETIDKALADGRITKEWADWMKQRPDDGTFGRGFGGRMPHMPHGWGGRFGGLRQPSPTPTPTR